MKQIAPTTIIGATKRKQHRIDEQRIANSLNTLKANPKDQIIGLSFIQTSSLRTIITIEKRKLESNSKLEIDLEKKTVRPDISRLY